METADAMKNLEQVTSTALLEKLGVLFSDAGFELALVGGPVRDAILGRVAPDVDLTTNATPDEILSLIKGKVDTHWEIGKEFGTIGARIGDDQIEITNPPEETSVWFDLDSIAQFYRTRKSPSRLAQSH